MTLQQFDDGVSFVHQIIVGKYSSNVLACSIERFAEQYFSSKAQYIRRDRWRATKGEKKSYATRQPLVFFFSSIKCNSITIQFQFNQTIQHRAEQKKYTETKNDTKRNERKKKEKEKEKCSKNRQKLFIISVRV